MLDEILEDRKKSLEPQVNLFEKAFNSHSSSPRVPLSQNIGNKGAISIISEIKPSSPTLGNIRNEIDVSNLAKQMEEAGAIGLSILTEPNYFNGSFENLKNAIEATNLPCLMKDFVFHESQFRLAKAMGATNILLIAQLGNLSSLYQLAIKHDLEPLIELHDKKDLAIIDSLIEEEYHPTLIGVNNRDLKKMIIDLNISRELIPLIKERLGSNIVVISESGISNKGEIEDIMAYGADAFLIGSSIMQSDDIPRKIKQLRGTI